jgi:hypothetical protein
LAGEKVDLEKRLMPCDYQVEPSYVYYDDYGWYNADAYPNFRVGYYDDGYDDSDDDYDDYDYIIVDPAD